MTAIISKKKSPLFQTMHIIQLQLGSCSLKISVKRLQKSQNQQTKVLWLLTFSKPLFALKNFAFKKGVQFQCPHLLSLPPLFSSLFDTNSHLILHFLNSQRNNWKNNSAKNLTFNLVSSSLFVNHLLSIISVWLTILYTTLKLDMQTPNTKISS